MQKKQIIIVNLSAITVIIKELCISGISFVVSSTPGGIIKITKNKVSTFYKIED